MKDSIEETKQMLESYYEDNSDRAKDWMTSLQQDMTEIVVDQLALPRDQALKFVHNWFDNRH